MTICFTCLKPIADGERFRLKYATTFSPSAHVIGIEHFNCSNPTQGAVNPEMNKTVAPDGAVTKLKWEGMKE